MSSFCLSFLGCEKCSDVEKNHLIKFKPGAPNHESSTETCVREGDSLSSAVLVYSAVASGNKIGGMVIKQQDIGISESQVIISSEQP